jgi:hypothetical protein
MANIEIIRNHGQNVIVDVLCNLFGFNSIFISVVVYLTYTSMSSSNDTDGELKKIADSGRKIESSVTTGVYINSFSKLVYFG